MASAAAGGKRGSRSTAVKRLMREYQEFVEEPSHEYSAGPVDEDDLFEWHFTIRGPPDTEFEGGIYHGRIILPSDYPFKPPDIVVLTPSGRFKTNVKICLSITGFHPKSWQPSWGIRTALIALRAFMPTKARGAIGSLEYTKEERRRLAAASPAWRCARCGRPNHQQVLDEPGAEAKTPGADAEPELDAKSASPSEAGDGGGAGAGAGAEDDDDDDAAAAGDDDDGAAAAAEGLRHRESAAEAEAEAAVERGAEAAVEREAGAAAAAADNEAAAPERAAAAPAAPAAVAQSRGDAVLSLLTVVLTVAIVVLLLRKMYRRSQAVLGEDDAAVY